MSYDSTFLLLRVHFLLEGDCFVLNQDGVLGWLDVCGYLLEWKCWGLQLFESESFV